MICNKCFGTGTRLVKEDDCFFSSCNCHEEPVQRTLEVNNEEE